MSGETSLLELPACEFLVASRALNALLSYTPSSANKPYMYVNEQEYKAKLQKHTYIPVPARKINRRKANMAKF